MRKIPAFFLLFFIITACSDDNEEAITKADYISEDPVNAAENEKDMDALEYIEFQHNEEQIIVDISKIPILHEFLRMHQHPQQAIRKMKLEKLELSLQDIYTLSFSCRNESCSYILLHQNQNKQATLVADMARFVSSYSSPDESKVALHFIRHGAETIPLSSLVVFDIVEWKPLSITKGETAPNILNYSWPFLSVEWLDEKNIAIAIPDLIEPNKESYDEWTMTEGNSVNTIVFQIETE